MCQNPEIALALVWDGEVAQEGADRLWRVLKAQHPEEACTHPGTWTLATVTNLGQQAMRAMGGTLSLDAPVRENG
jgi:hypothetical protein